MKEFYGEITEIRRISFCIEAENEEEAKQKIFEASLSEDEQTFKNYETEEIFGNITEVDAYFVDECSRGNVQQHNVRDFWIEEEK